MIYFDNAATTGKKPQSVINAVDTALKKYCANPGRSGHNLSVETAIKIYETRQQLASFFGCEDAQNVAFTLNCTHALNCIIKGVLKKGDHIVVSSLEHNAVMRPINALGVNYDIAEVSLYDDRKTIRNFSEKIRNNTKMVICTGASNVLGKILPIAEIGKICSQKGVLFLVDGAQLSGIKEINMGEMNIDFLCIAPHKGLYAPMGIGVLLARKPIEKSLIEGGTGSDSINFAQPTEMPDIIESGTVNVPAVLGLQGGLEFVKKIGVERIAEHEGMLCNKVYKAFLKNPQITLYSPYNPKDFAPVISFNLRDYSGEETAKLLNDRGIAVRGGLHCAPTAHKVIDTLARGTARFSPSIFNNAKQVDYFLNIINNL